MALDLVFCGTPRFAVPTLERLVAARHRVHLVVTRPDRPKGRGLELVASPAKESALKLDLPITQPDRINNNPEFRTQIAALQPDAIIVVGYGRIIPQWMLDLPRLGNINLHGSLLPKYRGAAPIQWAIARGETVTGVTTMRLNAGLDTGDILLQQQIPITPNDTAETVALRLATLGADLMMDTLQGFEDGTVRSRPQDSALATSAPILKKEDGRIDFSRPAVEIFNRMRGFQPWPGAYTKFRGKNLEILEARPASDAVPVAELRVQAGRLLVGCGRQTALELLAVQLEGKKRTSAADFVHGYRPEPAEQLGS